LLLVDGIPARDPQTGHFLMMSPWFSKEWNGSRCSRARRSTLYGLVRIGRHREYCHGQSNRCAASYRPFIRVPTASWVRISMPEAKTGLRSRYRGPFGRVRERDGSGRPGVRRLGKMDAREAGK
jgi:hypothetical protein